MTVRSDVLVLDTSVFIMGVPPLNIDMKLFTTPEVISELGNIWLKWKYSAAIQLGKLNVVSPKERFLKEVEKASLETGDGKKLSKADFSVLALTLELNYRGFKTLLVSDDYSIQNVAEHLGLNYENLAVKKIRSRIKWVWYCSACHRRFSSLEDYNVCPVCGSEVKRKATKIFDVKNQQ